MKHISQSVSHFTQKGTLTLHHKIPTLKNPEKEAF